MAARPVRPVRRRVTGLSPQQQRQVAVAIRDAREMALPPYPGVGR